MNGFWNSDTDQMSQFCIMTHYTFEVELLYIVGNSKLMFHHRENYSLWLAHYFSR